MFRKAFVLVVVPSEKVPVNRQIGSVARSILENIKKLKTVVERLEADVPEPNEPEGRIPPIFGGRRILPISEITDEHLQAVEGIAPYRTPNPAECENVNGLTAAELRKVFPDDFAVLVPADSSVSDPL